MSFLNLVLSNFSLSILNRYAALGLAILVTCASLLAMPFWSHAWILAVLAGALSILGAMDLMQTHHAVLRNYPILGHIRYWMETIRPEIRQYLLEADNDALPFSRSQRSLVYARAKNERSDKPFGTLMDVYQDGYEFISHSNRPVEMRAKASVSTLATTNAVSPIQAPSLTFPP